MEVIGAEVSQKLKSAIKAKLMELGAYVDDELSNYVMVMVTNRRSKAEMDRELQLFLGANTSTFTSWLQSVWMKLEQVTVTNSGIDVSKRKKKTKKGNKSSSESEDDKKLKKKRKSSTSEVVAKEIKKRKPSKTSSAGVLKTELFSEENLSDTPSNDPKSALATAPKKNKSNPVNTLEEEDFLSIKEDFESEFLSDNESIEVPSKSKTVPVDNLTKKVVTKSEPASEKHAVIEATSDKKFIAKHSKESSETKELPGKRITPDVSKNTNSSKIILKSTNISDHKVASDERLVIPPARKPLIRERKIRSRSRSATPPKVLHCKSRSPIPALKFNQRSRSRLRSGSPSASPSPPRAVKKSRVRDSGSPPRGQSATRNMSTIIIKSRSRSPVSNKYSSASETSSSVVDARELINRKRAKVSANEPMPNAKEEKPMSKRQLTVRKSEIVDVDDVSIKRSAISRLKPKTDGPIVRRKSGERFKENVNVENAKVEEVDPDECYRQDDDESDDAHDDDDVDDFYEQNNKVNTNNNKFGRFVVSRQGGTRSVTLRSTSDKKVVGSANKNEASDLRGIRRTVYSDENTAETVVSDEYANDDDVKEENEDVKNNTKEEKVKICKSVMNQIVKYIKDDPAGNAGGVKTSKTLRTKLAANSTLIRKAMADAHKSLSGSKEESSKKKEQPDVNVPSSNNKISEERASSENLDRFDVEEQVIADENRITDDEVPLENDVEYNPEDGTDHGINHEMSMDTEEYDPSKNMPQFVVTLTGVDPKIFPQDDLEMMELDPMMDDIRLKPRSQERCKYYPNCLAADQCLYYHPVIPCKMFPNCKYGNNCLYIHPKCKFDSFCTRYDCTYLHNSPRILPAVPARHPISSGGVNPQPCKYYYNCTNPMCPYQHPKLCRYDRYCTNKNCTFSHTSLSHVGSHLNQYSVSKDKLKWCRPRETDFKNDNAGDAKAEVETSIEN